MFAKKLANLRRKLLLTRDVMPLALLRLPEKIAAVRVDGRIVELLDNAFRAFRLKKHPEDLHKIDHGWQEKSRRSRL